MNANALEIRGLEKSFDRFHLGPLDMTVPPGAIYGLIGPNGAGKTTMLDLILGLGLNDAGAIKVFGFDHRRDEVAVKEKTAYATPDVSYRAWGTIGKAIRFVRGFYPSWDDAYCEKLLQNFRLGADDKIRSLSFGSRIKLGVVLALSWRPRLLILDEPTAGLDTVSKQEVFAELLSAVQDESRGVIVSSHNLADLERFADHLGVIRNGKMLLEGATNEIIEAYRVIDFTADRPEVVPPSRSFIIQRRDGPRWRALVDVRKNSLDALAANGARQISSAPVTLEDLFVALVRD
jgi:ABC-2 type transport system ATP-binding protein